MSSYCTNLDCPKPKNPPRVTHCQACGSLLRLRDRYRALRALGRGGFGATFLARDESLPGHPLCVIKQLRPSADAQHILDMARDLFQREAKILGKIGNHPQLPRLLDYFETNQEFFLVQEFINGKTLQQEVRQGGPFSEAGVRQFLSEALPLIQYVHESKVIHRDIKPANLIRRDEDKKLVLIDFGAVKDKVNPSSETLDQTTLTAYAIGTPGYAPPEQMAMRPVYASDLYAIGVTCIYLLTAKSPKDLNYDPTTGEMMWRGLVHVSDHFAQVLQKMLEISVRHRYQSVEAILRDLDLEPYMDSLAQNMAFPNSGNGRNDPTADGNPAYRNLREKRSPVQKESPSSRMAAAIRARRERASSRSSSNSRNLNTVNGYGMNSVIRSRGDRTTGNTRSGGTGKLSADALKDSYGKGRRDFSMLTLTSVDLQRVSLSDGNFSDAKLQKANFQNSDLSNVNFGRADLTKASLRGANLGRAYFSSANLQNADLRGADLSYATLLKANLKGANLCGADLTGARITDDQLAVARTNWSTVYPNGKRGLMR
ncbi:serine/threonine-protein kinase [Oscillatoria sp. CS-180]|uniref:serine/threonine-protein kinase n=1 Tax=Oscillatoria sp. CS-180 TaxID=3021720 RepID=UPI0023303CC5|nr:serine/threonine-protein kinase [Oscillatoria sp. CS-180]MDB9526765.1 serine/threonine-protein kinase [Oscillatoria sp. CS-180]